LGLKTSQFNMDAYYPETGLVANQITTLERRGLLKFPTTPAFDLKKLASGLPPRPGTVEGRNYSTEQARAYLDVNCSYCHNETPADVSQGPGWFASFDAPFSGMNVCNRVPVPPATAIPANLITLHAQYANGTGQGRLMTRMNTNTMPWLAKSVRDEPGQAAVGQWIYELADTCGPSTVSLKSFGISNNCLTTPTTTSGTITAATCAASTSTSSARQKYTLVDDGGGYVSVRSAAGTCVKETATVGQVRVGTCGTRSWRRVAVPGGTFQLRAMKLVSGKLEDTGRCLQASATETNTVTCGVAKTQLWTTAAPLP